ncbi:MAG: transcriptional repressor, partial [Bacteroidetes bacterium]|nr:transcriptional repressor [Bacteroidota bacterium]
HEFKQHDHLICTLCGKVVEFCDPRIQNIKTSVANFFDFKIHYHSLNLFGACKDCTAKINNDNAASQAKTNLN